MGICQDLFLSSLPLSLHPTFTMLFLPRLTLLLSIAFIGFCCLTQVKAHKLPSSLRRSRKSCKTVVDECNKESRYGYPFCLDERGYTCQVFCSSHGSSTFSCMDMNDL